MSTFRNSSPTERAFQRDKQWQHPSRRQHVHGRIRPMNDNYRDPSGRYFIVLGLVVLAIFWGQILRWLF